MVLVMNPLQELARTLVFSKSHSEYLNLMRTRNSNGSFAAIGLFPATHSDEFKYWHRSSETVHGFYQYRVNLLNKKWPLEKVFYLYFLVND